MVLLDGGILDAYILHNLYACVRHIRRIHQESQKEPKGMGLLLRRPRSIVCFICLSTILILECILSDSICAIIFEAIRAGEFNETGKSRSFGSFCG